MNPSILFTLAFVSSASASTLLFDFGRTDIQTPGNWNNVVPTTTILNNLVDSNGVAGPVGLEITNPFFNNGEPSSLGTESPSGAAGIFPVTATDDYLFGHTTAFAGAEANPLAQVRLFNLDPNTVYSFTFFAARTGVGDVRDALYSVDGATSDSIVLNASNNDSEVARIFGIAPDVNDEIFINVEPGPANDNGNGFYYLGLMQVVARPIPEPSGVLLLTLGSLLGVCRRRRPIVSNRE